MFFLGQKEVPIKSRKEVDLNRTYKFKFSNKEWSGIPIIASNMDGVGELECCRIVWLNLAFLPH